MLWWLCLSSAFASDFSFVVLSDTQGEGEGASINAETLPQLMEDIRLHEPDVLMVAGGLVAGSELLDEQVLQWEDFKLAVADYPGDLMLLPGTSDLAAGEGSYDAWRSRFDMLPVDDSPSGEEGISYYRDYGSVRLVSIASDQEIENRYRVSDAGMEWLERVLGERSDVEHLFVMTHHPVSFSEHLPDGELEDAGMGHTGSAFWQMLLEHDVLALFAGHWNRYQAARLGNGGSTWEFIVGTGGGLQNFEAVRPYQERVGYVLVTIGDEGVVATLYGDEDEDGRYDNPVHTVRMDGVDEPAVGLVARYSFDEDIVVDSAPAPVGFGISGRLEGNAEIVTDGASGSALQVIGDGDFAEVSGLSDQQLGLLGDLSVSMWAKVPALNSGDSDNVLLAYASQDLFGEDEQSNYAYRINVLADGRLQVFWEYENGTDVSVISSLPGSIDDDAWHHIGVVRDATRKRVDFYLDGEPLGYSGSFVRSPTGASRGMLFLGADIAERVDEGTGAGQWFWSDGSELSYTAWAVGEPNDWGGNQDCGVMNWGGSVEEDWDDLDCSEVRPFICQGPEMIEVVPDTGETEDGVECIEENFEGDVTLFCTTGQNWMDAREECLARGLDLVSIQTAEEQAWLVEQGDLIGEGYNWYMGLRERESVGAIDEVCMYNTVLGASEMSRLGELEDCLTVLDPLPEEPEEPEEPTEPTEPVDTGEEERVDDDASASDSGSSPEGDAPPELEDAPLDTGSATISTSVDADESGKGCQCSNVQPRTSSWALWLGLLGLIRWRHGKRRGCP